MLSISYCIHYTYIPYLKVWFNVNSIILERNRVREGKVAALPPSQHRQTDRQIFTFFYILFSSWFLLLRLYSYALCSQFILFLFFAFLFLFGFSYVRFLFVALSPCVCFSCFSSFYFSTMFIRNTRRIHILAADGCLAHLYARCYAISLFTYARHARLSSARYVLLFSRR